MYDIIYSIYEKLAGENETGCFKKVLEACHSQVIDDKTGDTICHVAVRKNDTGFLQFLISNGFNFTKDNNKDYSPLCLAILLEYNNIVDVLLRHIKINDNFLIESAKDCPPKVIKFLFDKIATYNMGGVIISDTVFKKMSNASLHKKNEAVTVLLLDEYIKYLSASNVNLYFQNLHNDAVKFDCANVIEKLYALGYSHEYLCGNNILHLAASYNSVAVINKYKTADNVKQKNNSGKTPLGNAIYSCQFAAAAVLAKYSPSVLPKSFKDGTSFDSVTCQNKYRNIVIIAIKYLKPVSLRDYSKLITNVGEKTIDLAFDKLQENKNKAFELIWALATTVGYHEPSIWYKILEEAYEYKMPNEDDFKAAYDLACTRVANALEKKRQENPAILTKFQAVMLDENEYSANEGVTVAPAMTNGCMS